MLFRSKELGFLILTCSFLSLVELAGKNVKVLIVLERSMRKPRSSRHRCSSASWGAERAVSTRWPVRGRPHPPLSGSSPFQAPGCCAAG